MSLPDIRLLVVARDGRLVVVDVEDARPVPDALDERPQSVLDHPLVEEAAPARVLLVQLLLAGGGRGRLTLFRPVLLLRNVDEGALEALSQVRTFFSQVLGGKAGVWSQHTVTSPKDGCDFGGFSYLQVFFRQAWFRGKDND